MHNHFDSMELQYIWINDYRTISQQGFNFGGKYIFDFDFESGQLSCESNPQFITDFFGSKISNVTAIIGANGSGKSTFLDFIKLNIAHDIGNTNLNYLCILTVPNEDTIYIYNTLNITIKLPDGMSSRFKNTKKGRIEGQLISLRYPTAFIYYSPIVDLNFDYETTPIDLSTTSILRNTKPINNSRHKLFDDITFIEIKKQLQFISNYSGSLPFDMPEELVMNPYLFDSDAIISKIESNDQIASNLKYWKNIFKREHEAISDRSTIAYTRSVYESLFWAIINFSQIKHEIYGETIRIPFLDASPLFKPVTNNPTKEIVEHFFSSFPTESKLPTLQALIRFSSLLDKLLEQDAMNFFFARFNLDIGNPEKFNLINDFLNSYYEISSSGDFLTFDWGLSSGEQSYLSMYARFFESRDKIKEYGKLMSQHRTLSHNMMAYDETPEVVILIDEGETSFHPQWQKEFLYNLCNSLPELLNVNKLQLVLASNSPFLISDLPKSNIIFVEKVGRKTKVVDRKISSFSANIHDLLAFDFFLDVPVGKFAKEKIEAIIAWLGSDQKLDNLGGYPENILKVIHIIDDPIIRNKLLQMYALKMNNETWDEFLLVQQQKVIEQRLKEIRKK
jgi:predicted ATPase